MHSLSHGNNCIEVSRLRDMSIPRTVPAGMYRLATIIYICLLSVAHYDRHLCASTAVYLFSRPSILLGTMYECRQSAGAQSLHDLQRWTNPSLALWSALLRCLWRLITWLVNLYSSCLCVEAFWHEIISPRCKITNRFIDKRLYIKPRAGIKII